MDFSYGYRFEIVLRRFGISRRLSYVDASVLENNILHSRRQAKKRLVKKIRTKKFQVILNENEKAKTLCVEALKLDVEKDAEFHLLVEKLEEATDLLNLRPTL